MNNIELSQWLDTLRDSPPDYSRLAYRHTCVLRSLLEGKTRSAISREIGLPFSRINTIVDLIRRKLDSQ